MKTISKTKYICPRFYTFKDTMNHNNIAEKKLTTKIKQKTWVHV